MGAIYTADRETTGRGRIVQSRNSTSTSTPSRTAAARTIVRIEFATRPRLPIKRPTSGGDTRTDNSIRAPLVSSASTCTASGSSTSDLARYSSTAMAVGAEFSFSLTPSLLLLRRLEDVPRTGDLEQLLDAFGRLRAVLQPVQRPVVVDLDERRLYARFVGADDLDEAPVAGRMRVGRDHAVGRLLGLSHPHEAEFDGHG